MELIREYLGEIFFAIGVFLILLEMLTSITAFFLAIVGVILAISGVVIGVTGVAHEAMIGATLAITGSGLFFLINKTAKNTETAANIGSSNVFVGEVFEMPVDLAAGRSAEKISAFGIDWKCTNVDDRHLKVGDTALITKADVGHLKIVKDVTL